MHKLKCILSAIIVSYFISSLNAQSIGENNLTISAAINKAIENNSGLKILLNNIEVQKSTKLQNGLLPNPVFDIEAENILGNDNFSGFHGSEITASISQEISLSGKISKLEKIANADISIAEWEYKIERLKVITNVKRKFVNALAVKILIDKNSELIEISNKLINNLERRVRAGKISPAEVSRSQLILNSLEINIAQLKMDYQNSIFELDAIINEPLFSFNSVSGKLTEIKSLPNYDSLMVKLTNNPNLKKFESEYNKHKAEIIFEKSKSIPNLTVSGGYKRLNEVNANTFLVGASLPLPIFNRNQGSIQRAKILLGQKSNEFNKIKNKLTLQLNLNYNKLKMLLSSAKKLKIESLPIAEEAFEIISKGNQVGRFKILDVLDVQRTLFEVQNQYLNTVCEINKVMVELEGLTNFDFN